MLCHDPQQRRGQKNPFLSSEKKQNGRRHKRENCGLAFIVQIGLNCQTKEGLITLPLSNCGVVKTVFV